MVLRQLVEKGLVSFRNFSFHFDHYVLKWNLSYFAVDVYLMMPLVCFCYLLSFHIICFWSMLAVDYWSSIMWGGVNRECAFTLYISLQAVRWDWAYSRVIKAHVGCPKRSFTAIYTGTIISNTILICFTHWVWAWTWTALNIEIPPFSFEVEEWNW